MSSKPVSNNVYEELPDPTEESTSVSTVTQPKSILKKSNLPPASSSASSNVGIA